MSFRDHLCETEPYLHVSSVEYFMHLSVKFFQHMSPKRNTYWFVRWTVVEIWVCMELGDDIVVS